MEDHLRNSRLFSAYCTTAKNVYGGVIAESLKSLREEIDNQIEGIVLDFHAVVADEGEMPEAERAPSLANELRSLIQSGQATLDDTKRIAQQLNGCSD
jgi:UTP:GlnB (protein PII) uridylyltransferase